MLISEKLGKIVTRRIFVMRQTKVLSFFALALFLVLFSANGFAQKKPATVDIQVVSEEDLTPSVVKALPNWQAVKSSAVYIRNTDELKKSLGERPIFSSIDFAGGTDAATAPYEAGKLLIVEFNSPQTSIDADNLINQRLAESSQNPPVYYRRVGNYAVFALDANDAAAANALIDQVKYEKTVQWLGENPNIIRQAEKAFIQTSSEIFLSTFLAIALGVGSTLLLGIGVGVLFFYLRKQKRAEMTRFSDAGGMVRLNLDDLSEVLPDKLLKE